MLGALSGVDGRASETGSANQNQFALRQIELNTIAVAGGVFEKLP